jgi:hypothetical protein
LLTEQFAHALRDDATNRVLRPTRGKWNDHRHRASRELLGAGLTSRHQRGEGSRKHYLFH